MTFVVSVLMRYSRTSAAVRLNKYLKYCYGWFKSFCRSRDCGVGRGGKLKILFSFFKTEFFIIYSV